MFGGSFAWHFKKGLRGLKFGIWSNDFSGQGFDSTVDFKKQIGSELDTTQKWTQVRIEPR